MPPQMPTPSQSSDIWLTLASHPSAQGLSDDEMLETVRQEVLALPPQARAQLPQQLQDFAYSTAPNAGAMIGRAFAPQVQPQAPSGPTIGDLVAPMNRPALVNGQPLEAEQAPAPDPRAVDLLQNLTQPTWGEQAAAMGIRTVPAVAGGALGGPVGAAIGGALGEAAAEYLVEGRDVNPWQAGVAGALNMVPGMSATGGATRLGLSAVENMGESALANNTIGGLLRAGGNGMLLAPVSTVGTNWAEGRPLTENMGASLLMGGAFGAATHGAIEAAGAAAPYVGRAARQVGRTVGDILEANPRLADETGAVGQLGSRALPQALRSLESVLPAAQFKNLVRGAETTPGAREALAHLQPSEIEPLTRSAGAVERFVETFKRLPDRDYLAAAIKRGAPKQGWYENSRRALQHLFGADADMFTGVLASMSPQTSVESNLTNALNMFVNWKAAGRPTDATTIKAIINRSVQGGSATSALDAWVDNTVRVLQGGQTISGPKIDQFWLALRDRALQNKLGSLDSTEAMVLDAWMGNVMGAEQELWSGGLSTDNREARLAQGDSGVTPYYLAGVARMREAAKHAGVTGAEAQEMAWSTAMALYERASSLGLTARQVLEQGLLEDAHVAGTPDFSMLLRQPMFASILERDAELGGRLGSLADLPHTPGRPVAMSSKETRDMLRVADTLDSLRAMRRADTAIETPNRPASHLTAVVPMEAATDQQWSSLLPYAATPEARKAINRLSPQVASAGESLRSQNTLLDIMTRSRSGSRMKGTGSWTDDQGRLQENPLAAYGIPLETGATGKVSAKDERKVRVARDVVAMMTGQSTAAHVIIDPNTPRATHDALVVYAGRKIEPADAKAFAAGLRTLDPRYTPIQTGRSVRVIRIDADGNAVPLTPADEQQVRAVAAQHLSTTSAKGRETPPKFETGTNVARDGYREIAQGAAAYSGTRVRRVVGSTSEWAALSSADKRALDAQAQATATRLLKVYDMDRVRAERADEARMLETIAASGLTGLARALGAGAVLPGLLLLGLTDRSESQ